MAKSSKGIRAGRAYVELFADDSALRRGLAAAQKRVMAFGASVRSAGLQLVAAGTGIIAPLLASAKVFSDTGDRLAKMAIRTGIAADALSELEYAADLSGASVEDLENGVRKMQKSISDAGRGLSTLVEALKELGLSAEALSKLTPEQQFETMADAISKVADPTKRAALMMDLMGRSGTKLIPLMAGGAKAIRLMREEAAALGLTLTKEDAKAAEELNDAMGRVKFTIRGVAMQVGAAIAGPLTKAANAVAKLVSKAIAWIKANREVVVTALAVGLATIAVGGALVTVGIAIQGLAFAIGGLSKAIGLLGVGLKLGAALLAALLSPIGLVVAAGAALVVMFTDWRTALGRAVGFIRGKLAELGDIFGKTWQGIRDAMASGNLALAAKIAWLGVKLAWMTGTQELRELWQETKTKILKSVSDLGFGMADVLVSAWSTIKTAWVDTVAFLKKTWAGFTSGAAIGFSSLTEIMSNLVTDAQFVAGAISEAEANRRKALNAQKTQNDVAAALQEEASGKAQAEADRVAAGDRIAGDEAAMRAAITNAAADSERQIKADNAKAMAATRKALTDAQAEFAAAIRQASDAAPGGMFGGLFNMANDAIAQAQAGVSQYTPDAGGVGDRPSRGLFNAAALQSLMGGREDRVAKATEKTAEATDELVRLARRQGLIVLGGG